MTLPATLKWILLALLGIAVAAAVAIAAGNLASRQIGLASEPISAGDALAPSTSAKGGSHGSKGGTEREAEPGVETTTPEPTTPEPITTPEPEPEAPPPAEPRPSREGDESHSGDGGHSGGGHGADD